MTPAPVGAVKTRLEPPGPRPAAPTLAARPSAPTPAPKTVRGEPPTSAPIAPGTGVHDELIAVRRPRWPLAVGLGVLVLAGGGIGVALSSGGGARPRSSHPRPWGTKSVGRSRRCRWPPRRLGPRKRREAPQCRAATK